MPQKTRKMKQRAAQRRVSDVAPVSAPSAAAPSAPVSDPTARLRPAFSNTRASTPLEFDYSYIYNDLKRIALFAAFFFVVLIALSFVIK